VLLDQVLVSGANFATTILLARYLGIEEFGRFTLAWMAVLFVNSVQYALGVSPMLSIGPKMSTERERGYYAEIIAHQVLLSLGAFLVILICGLVAQRVTGYEALAPLALPVAFATCAGQFQDFLRRYYFLCAKQKTSFATDALRYGGQVLAMLALLVAYPGAMHAGGALWLLGLSAAISILAFSAPMLRLHWPLKLTQEIAGRHWRFSRWVALSTLLQWLTNNFFTIVSGAMLGPAAAGTLRAAQALLGATHILLQGLENIIPAEAARRYHRWGTHALVRYTRRVAIVAGTPFVLVLVILAVAPRFWLGLVYGSEYADIGTLVRLYAVIYFFILISFLCGYALRALEQTAFITGANLVAAAIGVTIFHPLIASFGINGAALANAVVSGIFALVLVAGARRNLRSTQ
jgi:O-antigen/teichoic acid export membrane protein